jgi:hypothetical protein
MSTTYTFVAILLLASLPAGAAAQSSLIFIVKDIGAPATTLVME